MAAHWTNPDMRAHIDILKRQLAIFATIQHRMVRERRHLEARSLKVELEYLDEIIAVKQAIKDGYSCV